MSNYTFQFIVFIPKRGPIDPIKEKRSRLETYVEFTLCHTLHSDSVQIQYKVDLNYT